jgi:hypothetical protein
MVPEGRKDYWADYMGGIKSLLKLDEWELRFRHNEDPDDPGHAACVEFVRHRKVAVIRVAKDWEEQTPDEQRSTVIHELLHLHFEAPWRMMGDITRQLGKQAEELADSMIRHEMEVAIDQIAAAIAPHFPLPPAPKRVRKKA